LEQALERHKNGEAIVVPLILDYCDWENNKSIGKIQAIPKGGAPIRGWQNQNQAFLNAIQEIRKIAQELFALRQKKIEQKKADHAVYKAKVEEMYSPTGRDISHADQDTLEELREKLGLTKDEAKIIQANAYQPYIDQQEKLKNT